MIDFNWSDMIGGFPVPKSLLVVAPHGDLSIGTDIAAAVSGTLHTDVLAGNVSADRLADACGRQRWDMVYFGAHASDDGVQLTGEILDINRLCSVMEMANVRWVFLNACDSVFPGYQLMSAGIDVVCVFRSPTDHLAGMVARSFFHHLKTNTDPWHAYILSRPRFEVAYLYLPGRGLAVREKLDQIDRHLMEIDRKTNELMALTGRVDALEQADRAHDAQKWRQHFWILVATNLGGLALVLIVIWFLLGGQ